MLIWKWEEGIFLLHESKGSFVFIKLHHEIPIIPDYIDGPSWLTILVHNTRH